MQATLEPDGTIVVGARRVEPNDPAYPRMAALYAAYGGIDPGAVYAQDLARRWTAREKRGADPGEAELQEAARILAPLGRTLEFRGGEWIAGDAKTLSLSQGAVLADGKAVDLGMHRAHRRGRQPDPARSARRHSDL